MAERSLAATPTTRERGFLLFSTSPTVNVSRFAGEAARPDPPIGVCTGSSTTLTTRLRYGSHQSFATMPECFGSEPVSRIECPGPVSVAACRYFALLNTAPRSSSFLRPARYNGAKRSRKSNRIWSTATTRINFGGAGGPGCPELTVDRQQTARSIRRYRRMWVAN